METKNVNVDALIASQRSFMHDLASPLVIILGMLDIVLSQPEKFKDLDPGVITKIQKALTAAQKMETLLKANRKILVEGLPE